VNLHEYQAKEVFASYGVPVPDGQVARTPEEAAAATQALGGELWVVKAQVHAGGRGKVGGVKLVRSASEAAEAAKGMLGGRLVTKQTGEEGLPINLVYVETGSKIERELYLSLLVDRGSERVAIIASSEGGMDIEEVAEKTPEKILQININPATGLFPWQARKLGFALGLSAEQVKKFTGVLDGLYRMFVERDLSLVEINPLIVTAEGDIKALDGKVNVDGSALYRQQALLEYRDTSQEDETELKASEHDLNYVSLDGNIACMVNGAGLAMATMDLIKLHGGNPANFLDVGGGATAERVTAAFKLILANQKVKAILVNIFGGIVRCDLIAEGIIIAVKEVGVSLPVIVRLEGTNVEQGRKLLADSGLAITAAADLTDAARKAVCAAAAA
jgi:succinyl-CoA synthetase beta subunit